MNDKREFRRIMKTPKYMRVLGIMAVVVLLICAVIYAYIKYMLPNVKQMSYDSEEGTYAYVDVDWLSVGLGKATDDNQITYYQILDGNNLPYIMGMNDKNLKKMIDSQTYSYSSMLDKMMPDSIRVYGRVEFLKEDDAKRMAKDSYQMSEENFYLTVGNKMLNGNLTPINTEEKVVKILKILEMIALIDSIFCLIFAIYFIGYSEQIKKTIKRLEKNDGIYKIMSEFNRNDVERYDKLGINLTENYVIGMQSGVAVSYQSIIWIYTEAKYCARHVHIETGKALTLCTFDNEQCILVSDTRGEMVEMIAKQIAKRCDDVMFGYSILNSKEYRIRVKEYDEKLNF